MTCHFALLYIALFALAVSAATYCYAAADAALPEGVKVIWDLEKAFHEKSPTRERICINDLWRWQPAKDAKAGESLTVPSDQWGFFKVPGSYVDPTQTLHSHAAWSSNNVGATAVAWYQREITIPQDWTGRRITVSTDYVNSLAAVYVDGKEPLVNGKSIGIINFPGGEAD